MSTPNPFPMDPDYVGAEASVFVPVHAELPNAALSPDASQEHQPQNSPVPGDAGVHKESQHE
jgi:hypothetical protein